MRLIDADKAKAELLRIARDIHDCCGFYDGRINSLNVLLIGYLKLFPQ